MATIIDIRSHRPHDPPVHHLAASGQAETRSSAEIVLFPGIRYEYGDRPETGKPAAAKYKAGRRTKRDVLDIDS